MNKFVAWSGCVVFLATFLVACTGNPWQQFMINTVHRYQDKDFSEVKKDLEQGGRYETTPESGYDLPNGNRQHEFDWGTRNNQTCTLLLEVNNSTNTVVSVGGKGGLYACHWGG